MQVRKSDGKYLIEKISEIRNVPSIDRGNVCTLDEAQKRGVKVWIRHVIVPGLTDDDEQLDRLVEYLKGYPVVEKIEWLPYHTMGVFKYEQLGLPYPLKDVEPLSAERIKTIRERYKDVFPVQK